MIRGASRTLPLSLLRRSSCLSRAVVEGEEREGGWLNSAPVERSAEQARTESSPIAESEKRS